jgi:hypothetical protein
VLLLAAFQVAAAGIVPVADAMSEIAATSEPMHVESARDSVCGDGHDHLFCQLCRTLAVASVPRGASRVCHPPQQTVLPATPFASLTDFSFLHSSGPFGPRAPPLA